MIKAQHIFQYQYLIIGHKNKQKIINRSVPIYKNKGNQSLKHFEFIHLQLIQK